MLHSIHIDLAMNLWHALMTNEYLQMINPNRWIVFLYKLIHHMNVMLASFVEIFVCCISNIRQTTEHAVSTAIDRTFLSFRFINQQYALALHIHLILRIVYNFSGPLSHLAHFCVFVSTRKIPLKYSKNNVSTVDDDFSGFWDDQQRRAVNSGSNKSNRWYAFRTNRIFFSEFEDDESNGGQNRIPTKQ